MIAKLRIPGEPAEDLIVSSVLPRTNFSFIIRFILDVCKVNTDSADGFLILFAYRTI